MNKIHVLFGLFVAVAASAQIPTTGTSDTASLTNKTIDASSNTLLHLPLSKNGSGVLGSLRSANMNSTADQAISINAAVTAWEPTGIQATNCTGTLTLAAGGVYSASSKAGTALVGSLQAYSSLTGATVVLPMTMAAGVATTRYTIGTVYFSLSTAAGGASTCDIYILGVDLT